MDKVDLIGVTKSLTASDDFNSKSAFAPSDEHLALINQYTLKDFAAEEIAAFPIRAMNDKLDRDYDRFTSDCIDAIAADKGEDGPLGKPFICSHYPGDLAKGRIYLAETERVGKINHLKLWVYIPNTAQYEAFIENIAYGVYWAVSVGVGFKEYYCSICKDAWPSFYAYECNNGHVKGQKVGKELCFAEVNAIKGFYELSTVYLGAQYGAQVVKKVADKDSSVRSLVAIKAAIKEANDEDDDKRKISEIPKAEKAVVPFKAFPLADESVSWSFSSDDGNKLLRDDDNWNEYKSVHVWFDSEYKESKVGYKLPHHKIIDEEIKTVWKGVMAAGNVLMVTRCGADIPEEDVDKVKSHLEKHYKEFNKTPPWDDEKIAALVKEGAILEFTEGGFLIKKGTKIWFYDGEKVIRKEVKQVKEEIDRLNKELNTSKEEVSALEATMDQSKTALKEANDKVAILTREVEASKEELAAKSKVADHYVESLKADVMKFFKLSKGAKEESEDDTNFVTKLMEKCGDDPELLKGLAEDFKGRAEKEFPSGVRRSSEEDETGVVKVKEANAEDADSVANNLHG